jgi:poly(ADP-ribose) glycohydrolase
MHVGSTPEACTAVLVTPPLCDGDVLVVRGVQAIIEIGDYGRDAELKATSETGMQRDWSKRTMLFMDALELDSFDAQGGYFIPDVLPGNMDRELMKSILHPMRDCRYMDLDMLRSLPVFGAVVHSGVMPRSRPSFSCVPHQIARVPLVFVCESVNRLSIYNSCCCEADMSGFKSKISRRIHSNNGGRKMDYWRCGSGSLTVASR